MSDETVVIDVGDSPIEVRSASERIIDVRLMPWDTIIETRKGAEMFARGAYADTPDDGLLLMGMEHEAKIGLGQNGEPMMTRHAIGRSVKVWEADDGAHASFRVGRTSSGDDLLALAEDGIVRGVSAEFAILPDGTNIVKRGGRSVRVHSKVKATGASLTYRPAYGDQSVVLAVRTEEPVSEAQEVETTAPAAVDLAPLTRAMQEGFDGFSDRLSKIEEGYRSEIIIPGAETHKAPPLGRWMKMALGALTGERIPEQEMRVWADLITSDNLGVVPEAHLSEIIGVIDASRPFLGSTTRLNTPASGMTLNVPVIETRPTAGVQVNEKDDITSTETSITSAGFDAVTIAGGGDISLQLLKRSDPSYLELYIRLLAEAISENAEAEALDALLGAGVTPGTGTLDPENLLVGEAWTNARAVRQRANTIWLSSAAMELFIDAKIDGSNAPLYGNLGATITVGSDPTGLISGLRPVYVPALDDTAVDVMVGPSRGFAWAEDGAFTLQVDVPSKAGRDVALVVIDWYCPLYPEAFTTWAV